MTDFGVTDAGFVAKSQQDILADIERDQLATIGPLLDVSADSPNGQNNGIVSRELAIVWELVAVAYNAFDRDRAEGDSLISLAKLNGTVKQGATFSRVACTIDLDNGATLESGTHFAHLDGNPDVRFTPEVDYTATSSGAHAGVVFRAENLGPVIAPAGQLDVIATAVVGWNSVTNPLDASPGHNADTDPELRLRMEQDLAASGSSTADALRADVLQTKDALGVQFVQSCTVFENTGDETDTNGLPPHSFEVLVFDGDTPPSTQSDLIAQTIWDNKAAGIRSFGGDTGNAIDSVGATQVVSFSRVVRRDVFLVYTISRGPNYIGDAALQEYIVEQASAAFNQAGDDVLFFRLASIPFGGGGVLNVTALTLGFSSSPIAVDDLQIGIRELPRFDTTRITLL